MSITTIFAIYFLIWWLTLFTVLPFGMRREADAGELATGTDPGAPMLNVMWRKLGWTTLFATIAFALLYVLYVGRLIPFDWLSALVTPPRTY